MDASPSVLRSSDKRPAAIIALSLSFGTAFTNKSQIYCGSIFRSDTSLWFIAINLTIPDIIWRPRADIVESEKLIAFSIVWMMFV